VAPAARRRVVRVLDPCAGTGEPAAALAEALGGESYGIELSAERAERCRARLDRVLAKSAFPVRLANAAFSILRLNPPYDAHDAQRGLEHAFLTGLSRAMCPGGVLVFLLPQVRLAGSARYLAAHYAGLRAYRFPDPEYGAFTTGLLVGVPPTPTGRAPGGLSVRRWLLAGAGAAGRPRLDWPAWLPTPRPKSSRSSPTTTATTGPAPRFASWKRCSGRANPRGGRAGDVGPTHRPCPPPRWGDSCSGAGRTGG
jgi:hypothetical protein